MQFTAIVLSTMIVTIVLVIMLCLLGSWFRCCEKTERNTRRNDPVYPITTAPKTNNFTRSHRRISSVGDRFAVPVHLLPQNFNYSSPDVEYKGDHVIVKDLKQIEVPHNDEYLKQEPYNPNYM